MNEPTIKIVMPCFNGERFLEKSLASFFSQDCPNKQLIIVDGKSTDGSHAIIEKFITAGCPIVWDRTPDTGITSAIKIGLRHLTAKDVYCCLGSDDILLPGVLSEVSRLFAVVPELDGVFFDSYNYHCAEKKMVYRKCPTTRFTLENLVKYGSIVGGQNIFISARLDLAGSFSDENKYSMDYELHLRLTKNGASNFAYVPRASSINFLHDNTSVKFAREQALEAVRSAIDQVGYAPWLLWRRLRIALSDVKRRALFMHRETTRPS